MLRIAALASLFMLGACASGPPVLDGPTALNGKDLGAAQGLYGPYAERVMLAGRENYIWRRSVVIQNKTYFCELRVQTGFRDGISSVVQEGYAPACGLFSVQYKNTYGPAPDDRPIEDKSTRVADRQLNYRPVGEPPAGTEPVQLSER